MLPRRPDEPVARGNVIPGPRDAPWPPSPRCSDDPHRQLLAPALQLGRAQAGELAPGRRSVGAELRGQPVEHVVRGDAGIVVHRSLRRRFSRFGKWCALDDAAQNLTDLIDVQHQVGAGARGQRSASTGTGPWTGSRRSPWRRPASSRRCPPRRHAQNPTAPPRRLSVRTNWPRTPAARRSPASHGSARCVAGTGHLGQFQQHFGRAHDHLPRCEGLSLPRPADRTPRQPAQNGGQHTGVTAQMLLHDEGGRKVLRQITQNGPTGLPGRPPTHSSATTATPGPCPLSSATFQVSTLSDPLPNGRRRRSQTKPDYRAPTVHWTKPGPLEAKGPTCPFHWYSAGYAI